MPLRQTSYKNLAAFPIQNDKERPRSEKVGEYA